MIYIAGLIFFIMLDFHGYIKSNEKIEEEIYNRTVNDVNFGRNKPK